MTIAGYFALLILTGFVFKRLVADGADYFRSGSKATWWMTGTSIFMAGFSAWTFTGAAAMAFSYGWSVLCIFIMTPLALLIQAFFFARRFRQLRATTIPELIRARYNPLTQQVYAGLTILLNILLGAIQLYALAIFLSAFFNVPVIGAIVVLGIVIGTYIILGGSWAIMGADNLQTVLVIGIVAIVTVLSLSEAGGVSGMFTEIKNQGLTHQFQLIKAPGEVPLGNFSIFWLLAMTTLYIFEGSSLSQAAKYFSVKDGRTATMAAVFAFILALSGMFIWFIPPIVARLFFADEVLASPLARPEEGAFAIAALHFLPAQLGGLLAIAVMGATISSMDVVISRNSAILVRDIAPLVGQKFPFLLRGSELFRARIASFFLCVTVCILALLYECKQQMGVFDLLQRILAMVSLPMTIPLALGILIKHTPSWSALATCGAGFIVTAAALISEKITGISWTFAESIFWTSIVCVLVYLGSMFFRKGEDEEYLKHVQKFFDLMKRPVDFAREVGAENDHLQFRAMSVLFLVAGMFIGALMLTSFPEAVRRPLILLIATFLFLGLIMFTLSFLKERKFKNKIEK